MKVQSNNVEGIPASVKNYLDKYSTSGWKPELPSDKKYNNVIVIPAIQEYENIKQLLLSLSKNSKKYLNESLILFVINNFHTSSDEVKEDNKNSLEYLRGIQEKNNIGNVFIDLNVGVIDASTAGNEMPEKEGGVGFARKTGIDRALECFDYSNNRKKIILSLDADCTIESNYLETLVELFNQKNISAAYVQYEHPIPDNEQEKKAIICYEIFLRYYALGLNYAGSKYAFPTIGSTIICDSESYVKVGGMNTKKAAEDFYFLEKLAKITNVEKIDDTKVYPSSRGSWRVPFGTGQRVNRFQNGTHDEYVLYAPEVFKILKNWLEVFNSKIASKSEDYINAAEKINPVLKDFLMLNDFRQSWDKITQNSKSELQIQKQKNIWFDGFRTLKLIHYLRDNGFLSINMFKAIDELFQMIKNPITDEKWMGKSNEQPPVEIQLEYLKILRSLT
jgi:hypothetical protein